MKLTLPSCQIIISLMVLMVADQVARNLVACSRQHAIHSRRSMQSTSSAQSDFMPIPIDPRTTARAAITSTTNFSSFNRPPASCTAYPINEQGMNSAHLYSSVDFEVLDRLAQSGTHGPSRM